MVSEYRPLAEQEVEQLKKHRCSCQDWSAIRVAKNFDPERITNTAFSGAVKLGVFDKKITLRGGLERLAGISNATIHNCDIGNNTYINNTRNYIANYIVEDNVIIENVDVLAVDGQTTFGNGTRVAVINEAGGREVAIYNNLSAQTAYILAIYRHRQDVIKNLENMIDEYTKSVNSSMGLICSGAQIINCKTIINVKIGRCAVLDGAARLENGSINSTEHDPAKIGAGVIAENFIACSGTKVTDNCILTNCFLGQGTEVARQFSAKNSLFFANCSMLQGEACSVFAGPHSVSHHKSTLLIAGLFSFLNAGSGTNQSNHMYKLGPVHQGIMERGSKTTSDSCMLWPMKIGAFTIIKGKHNCHCDTSDLPFSYLIGYDDYCIAVPGANLGSIGTVRDACKWPERDKRKDPEKLDFINYKLLNPYIVEKILNGCKLLSELKTNPKNGSDYLLYNGIRIKISSIEKGLSFYQMAIDAYIGECVAGKLSEKDFSSLEQLKVLLTPETKIGQDKWVDLAGLLAPKERVSELMDDIERDTIRNLEQVTAGFQEACDNFGDYEWAYVIKLIEQRLGKTIENITAEDVKILLSKFESALEGLNTIRQADAEKEFGQVFRTGYGIDGGAEIRDLDFQTTRGSAEENVFVKQLKKETAENKAAVANLIGKIKNLH